MVNKTKLILIIFLALIWSRAVVCPIVFAGKTGKKGIYYSIHLASFKYLKNANAYVNDLKNKGKVVFWKKKKIPGKGLFYRVYLGKFDNKDHAVRFRRRLKEDGAPGYCGIHQFTEPMVAERSAGSHKIKSLKQKGIKPDDKKLGDPTKGKEGTTLISKRFIDNKDGTIIDRKTNLMWIKNGWRLDFFSAVSWENGLEKCKKFMHGGYVDWAIPTLSQWSSLIDQSNQCPALSEPNPFENIIVHMPYWSRTEHLTYPSQAYTVMLYSGTIRHQNKKDLAFILPVRSMKKDRSKGSSADASSTH